MIPVLSTAKGFYSLRTGAKWHSLGCKPQEDLGKWARTISLFNFKVSTYNMRSFGDVAKALKSTVTWSHRASIIWSGNYAVFRKTFPEPLCALDHVYASTEAMA
jgi:hypothetical protein